MGSFVDMELCVPAFGPGAQPQGRHAYAAALAQEVGQARADLAGRKVRRVTVRRATRLADRELDHLFATLRRSADVEGATRVAEVEPERLSTGVMTPLRNFHTDLYAIDLGSLDATEFHALRRPYDFHVYELLEKLLASYAMHNWRAGLSLGIAGQTARTLGRSLDRLARLEPGMVRLQALEGVRAPGELVELAGHARTTLEARGYAHVNVTDYALPGYKHLAQTHEGPQAERWGFGLDAASLVEGVALRNEASLATYLERISGDGQAVAEAVRLDAASAACAEARWALGGLAGVDEAAFSTRHGGVLAHAFDSLCAAGLVRREAGRLALTEEGAVQPTRVRRALDPASPDFAR